MNECMKSMGMSGWCNGVINRNLWKTGDWCICCSEEKMLCISTMVGGIQEPEMKILDWENTHRKELFVDLGEHQMLERRKQFP